MGVVVGCGVAELDGWGWLLWLFPPLRVTCTTAKPVAMTQFLVSSRSSLFSFLGNLVVSAQVWLGVKLMTKNCPVCGAFISDDMVRCAHKGQLSKMWQFKKLEIWKVRRSFGKFSGIFAEIATIGFRNNSSSLGILFFSSFFFSVVESLKVVVGEASL